MADDNKKKEELDPVVLANVCFLLLIIMVAIFPNYGLAQQRLKQKNDIAVCEDNLNKIADAIVVYRKEHKNKFPNSFFDLVGDPEKGYLKELPSCPAKDEKAENTYSERSFKKRNGAPGRFTIFCGGMSHEEAGFKKNEPYYDSMYGILPLKSNRNAYGLMDSDDSISSNSGGFSPHVQDHSKEPQAPKADSSASPSAK